MDAYRPPPYDAVTAAPQPYGTPSLAPTWRQTLASPLQQAAPWPDNRFRGLQNDPRVVSDAAPDNDWRPGAQYANRRGGRGSGPVRIGNQWVELDPVLANRLSMAQAKAQIATARVRELDPSWRAQPSLWENAEGAIWAYEAEAEQAEARWRELTRFQTSPIIPRQRPDAASERNDVAREIARWLVKNQGQVVEGANWLFECEPSIQAYLDPPKSLEELQQAVSTPKPGFDIHHIAEKTSAEADGFPKTIIHGPGNLVRIPRFKHWQITSWYMTKNKDYEGLPPRDYLRGKDWAERTRVGLDALIQHGVLKQ